MSISQADDAVKKCAAARNRAEKFVTENFRSEVLEIFNGECEVLCITTTLINRPNFGFVGLFSLVAFHLFLSMNISIFCRDIGYFILSLFWRTKLNGRRKITYTLSITKARLFVLGFTSS
jgi:hypothetical protein